MSSTTAGAELAAALAREISGLEVVTDETEITAKLAKAQCRIYEVGISYKGRTYAEGKKVRWQDGLRAIYAILRYSLWA